MEKVRQFHGILRALKAAFWIVEQANMISSTEQRFNETCPRPPAVSFKRKSHRGCLHFIDVLPEQRHHCADPGIIGGSGVFFLLQNTQQELTIRRCALQATVQRVLLVPPAAILVQVSQAAELYSRMVRCSGIIE